MKKDEFDIKSMVKEMADGLRKASYSQNILSYVPHAKQEEFHQAENRGRLYIGGNRGGKTVGGATEAVWWLTHKHPYQRTPDGQIRGRCISVDFANGVEAIVKPEVKKWLPPSELINGSWEDSYDKVTRTLTLENGSFLEFKSYDQELEKHAGTSRHFCWFDEEPPQSIYEENMLRLLDTNGKWWITMTPVEGATWTLYELYEPAMDGLRNIHVTEINTEENPHVRMDVMDELMQGMDEDVKSARREGKYVHGSGLIFPMFDPKRHILDTLPFNPRNTKYRIVASVDLGLNAPTAWLWHAITPDGRVITFHEMVHKDWTIPKWCAEVKKWERENGIKPAFRVGDPAAKQRARQTGLSDQVAYTQGGLPFALGNNNVEVGLDKMRDYLNNDKWHILSKCGFTIKEFRKYRFEDWETRKLKDKNNPKEKPRKKDDHCMDSARYFFSFLPDLSLRDDGKDIARVRRVNEALKVHLNGRTGVPLFNHFDENFMPNDQPVTRWATDETIGGIW